MPLGGVIKRLIRLLLAVIAGILALVGGIWVLAQAVASHPTRYQGKTAVQWADQFNGNNLAACNEALVVFTNQLLPELLRVVQTDTNDSALRVRLVKTLNDLPGIQVHYYEAVSRRSVAAMVLGEFGPAAEPAIPVLIQKGLDTNYPARNAAVTALGLIHAQPDRVIPVLIKMLDDDSIDSIAAEALGNYGPLAKAAVPKILPLLHGDKDDVAAAQVALEKIDPEALAKAQKAKVKARDGKQAKDAD